MGQLIEYYVPAIFIPRQPRWTDLQQRGRILEFQKAGTKKSAYEDAPSHQCSA